MELTEQPIRLVYSVSDEDQREAVLAMITRQPVVRSLRIAAVVVPALMVAWSMSAGWSPSAALFRNTFWLALGALQLLFAVPLTVRAAVKAVRRADPDWAEEQVVSVDETAIHLEGASARAEIPWATVERAIEGRRVILLYFGSGRVLYIPVHVVTEQGMLGRLRRQLREKLGARARLGAETSEVPPPGA